MDFKFNFGNPVEDLHEDETLINSETDDVLYAKFRDIDPSSVDQNYLNAIKEKYKVIKIGDYTLKYLPSSTIIQIKDGLRENSVLHLSENNLSDLLPGVYEGGLKLWECSLDLMTFLHDNNCLTPNSKVLELGCGSGLPAILAYLKGCPVTFQDYNFEVLELSTIPNVIINTPESEQSEIPRFCNFIAGDWSNIEKEYYQDSDGSNKKYDVILTSETIYEKQSHGKLLSLMKCALAPDGTIYLVSKTHYFGVGGTLDDFEHLVMKDGSFTWKVAHNTSDGVQRAIVQMNFKKR